MKSAITVILGIILLCAAFSGGSGGFFRIRDLSLKRAGRLIMRLVYAAAGIFLIVSALAGYFNINF